MLGEPTRPAGVWSPSELVGGLQRRGDRGNLGANTQWRCQENDQFPQKETGGVREKETGKHKETTKVSAKKRKV